MNNNSRKINIKKYKEKGEKMIKKSIIFMIIFVIIFQVISPIALAIEIEGADIVFTGRTAPPDLLFKREDGTIGNVKCSIVGYYKDNNFYPVYCMNKELPGAETEEYSVNISDYIKNDKVWRVVTNGFPYNNMGLSDDDAYMVTKMAVFCVTGNSDFEIFTYDESNPITVQTYNALKNLVQNVAEDTSIVKQKGTIDITKVGDFIELGDYYYQEYKVDSKLEEESYEVKDLLRFS